MCLILFTFSPNTDTPLVLAANRDEFFSRPTANAHYWQDSPQILAGRDLVGNGTWIGMTTTGRFAAVTNVREPNIVVDNPLSRGDLTRFFLEGDQSCENYLLSLQDQQQRYSGFNLLVGEFNNTTQQLYYFSNRTEGITALTEGTYGLSNHLLDSCWPKVKRGKDFLSDACMNAIGSRQHHDQLRAFLEDPSLAADAELPSTGVNYSREKALSAAFISLSDYGTRTSTVITIHNNEWHFSETQYEHSEAAIKVTDKQYFENTVKPQSPNYLGNQQQPNSSYS